MSGDRLNIIKHKIERGLVPRDSDLFFVYTILMGTINEAAREKISHNTGTDGRTNQTIRNNRRRGSEKDGVREGNPIWTNSSNQENNTVEGG